MIEPTIHRQGAKERRRHGDARIQPVSLSPCLPVSLSPQSGHSLLELICTMVAGTILLAGLGSVMLVARQVAYSPAASSSRLAASQVVNQLADEVRAATSLFPHESRD